MKTATKTHKATATKTTTAPALTHVLPYEEKIRLMTLAVLKEECGQELYRSARYQQLEFDWVAFKKEFQLHYGELTTNELLALLKEYYGLSTIEQIKDRRAVHQERINRRINS